MNSIFFILFKKGFSKIHAKVLKKNEKTAFLLSTLHIINVKSSKKTVFGAYFAQLFPKEHICHNDILSMQNLAEGYKRSVLLDSFTLLYEDSLNDSVALGSKIIVHLHCLENDECVTFLNLLTYLCRYFDNRAWQR